MRDYTTDYRAHGGMATAARLPYSKALGIVYKDHYPVPMASVHALKGKGVPSLAPPLSIEEKK